MTLLRVTSSSNPRLKSAMRLREGRARRRAGLFLVDGVRELARALDAGIALDSLFISDQVDVDDLLASVCASETARGSVRAATLVQLVEPLFAQLAYGQRNEAAVGVFRAPDRSLDHFHPPSEPLLVVLDKLEKPGNIGAVFRSADAAGADGVILSDCATDLFNPNCLRASAGTVFAMPSAVASGAAVRQWLSDRAIRPIATRVDARQTHWQCEWRGGVAIVLGNEAEGLGPDWSGGPDDAIRIPMAGIADSLNASVTAAVCLYEAIRQRSAPAVG